LRQNRDDDDKQQREPTRYFDYYPLWLERLIEAEFPHLRRKKYQPPYKLNKKRRSKNGKLGRNKSSVRAQIIGR
jgi:hypothetical protein